MSETLTSNGRVLPAAAIAQYRDAGWYAPVNVLASDEALALRARLEAHERASGGPLAGAMRHKCHLLFTWLWDLVHDPRIVDAVEDVLGPNLLCWSSSFFIKEAHDPGFVSWHQDATYWGLSSAE